MQCLLTMNAVINKKNVQSISEIQINMSTVQKCALLFHNNSNEIISDYLRY